VVRQPGPRVTTAEALRSLESECASIGHKATRSSSGSLRTKYYSTVSRRDMEAKIKESRRQHNAEYRRGLLDLEWHGSGIVWAMDDTEYGISDTKYSIHNVRDLGAQYVMEPIVSAKMASGSMVAANLEKLFHAHGAPLILKRDNGSNLCCEEVDAILAKWMVLPLTSPPYCPKYNGAIEWSQEQLKSEIELIIADMGTSIESVSLRAKLASHTINHRESPSLSGRCPCHSLALTQKHFSRNERRIIKDCVEQERDIIFQRMGPKQDSRAAWRQAVTQWLTSNGLLSIRKPR